MLNPLFRFYYSFFSFSFWLCLLLKIESFGVGLIFDFFVFYLIVVKLESGLQTNNLRSFNLVLIWFGYPGFFFLSHAISLWFCVVNKLQWSFSLLNNSFQPEV